MKKIAVTSALFLTASSALAGGLDLTGQPVGVLFERGNYAEFGATYYDGNVSGRDLTTIVPTPGGPVTIPGGATTGNIGNSVITFEGAVKMDLNDRWSAALLFNQPWIGDSTYSLNTTGPGPGSDGSFLLGGTGGFADSVALTALARYKFNENLSAYGGLRIQDLDANLKIGGAASPPGFDGYNADIDGNIAAGYVVGVAYEIPEILARASLTYQSEVKHEMSIVETAPGLPGPVNSTTTTRTPQSLTLNLQSAVSRKVLLFGAVRWVDHSELELQSPVTGFAIPKTDDTVTYTIGAGYRFNEAWTGTLGFAYEKDSNNANGSVLGPLVGINAAAAGLRYTKDNWNITGIVRYGQVGDVVASLNNTDPLTQFSDNHVTSFTLKVGFNF